MDSIKQIYKIGYGPSSSHTMGPRKAAEIFRAKHPAVSRFRVTLYGSLAATGKGHLTDKAITAGLEPASVEIIWAAETVPAFHTNGMLFEALDGNGAVLDSWTVYSVGGGYLAEENQQLGEKKVYEHHLLLKGFLISLGVSEENAENDACAMEHILSEETMECIRRASQERPHE